MDEAARLEQTARTWTLEDGLRVVARAMRRLDQPENHQARADLRQVLSLEGLSWRWSHWSVEDLQRVAVILQRMNLWPRR